MSLRAAKRAQPRALKVIYDSDVFALHERGGMGRYFLELIMQFNQRRYLHVKPAIPRAFVSDVNALELTRFHRVPPILAGRGRSILAANEMQLKASIALMSPPFIHHSTHFMRPLRHTKGQPRVVTVHDMTPELFPHYFGGKNPHKFKREHVEAADLIICVSESTRRDMESVYGKLTTPIHVVPLASSPTYSATSLSAQREPRPFVLFVGQRAGYKNFTTFLQALSAVNSLGIRGVVAGAPLTPAEREEVRELNLTSELTVCSPSDQELANLYRRALAFIFPSRYEGFGIPVIEAMSSGCPCILSDIPAFREVAGESALLVPPGDAEALAAAILKVNADDVLRSRLIDDGRNRASSFSWLETARQTADAYRAI